MITKMRIETIICETSERISDIMEPIRSGRSGINLIWKGWRRKRSIRNKFDMEGLAPEAVVESLIHDYHLLPE